MLWISNLLTFLLSDLIDLSFAELTSDTYQTFLIFNSIGQLRRVFVFLSTGVIFNTYGINRKISTNRSVILPVSHRTELFHLSPIKHNSGDDVSSGLPSAHAQCGWARNGPARRHNGEQRWQGVPSGPAFLQRSHGGWEVSFLEKCVMGSKNPTRVITWSIKINWIINVSMECLRRADVFACESLSILLLQVCN